VTHPASWLSAMAMAIGGGTSQQPRLSSAQLGAAISDFVANDADRKLGLFRGYLRAATSESAKRFSRQGRSFPVAFSYADDASSGRGGTWT
jgi:hypothetical protein